MNRQTENGRGRRRSYAQLFLDKLTELSEGQQKLIGNKTVRDALGWEDAKYERVRLELVAQGKAIVGRGYGGTVGLATVPGQKPPSLSVFVSYSHADEAIKTELLKHLYPLQRLQLIDTWHDRKLKPGEEWDKVISSKLETADIVLLLVSIDFINSSYCYDVELERAIERHEQGHARVVPIIVRSCLWNRAPFSKLQALPKDARPISSWSDRDDALVNVVEAIAQLAEQLIGSK